MLTRPFGATLGDLLTKAPDDGGIGLGTRGASAVLATVLLALMAVAAWRLRVARTSKLS